MRMIRQKYYPGWSNPDEQRPREIDLVEAIRILCMVDLMLIASVSGTAGGRVDIVLRKSIYDGTHDGVSYYGSEDELQKLLKFIRIAQGNKNVSDNLLWRIYSVIDFFDLGDNDEIVKRYESYADFEEFLVLASLAHEAGISLAEAAAMYV